MIKTLQRITSALLCAGAVLFTGCAITPSTIDSISPTQAVSGPTRAGSVGVAVTGFDAHAVTQRHLSDVMVTDAIVASLEKNKSFSKVLKGANGDHRLNVMLVTAVYPAAGLDFTVNVEMAWTLKGADGSTLWQEAIRSDGKATTSEEFAGTARIRLAGERAIRANITQGLTKISALKL